MAVFALINQLLTINAVDLSVRVKSATLTTAADKLDTTAQGGGGYKSVIGGLKSGSLACEFEDDYALANVDATLWGQLGNVVAFELRPDAGARSTTNPGFTGNILVGDHVTGGAVGELAKKSLTFETSGTILRQTS